MKFTEEEKQAVLETVYRLLPEAEEVLWCNSLRHELKWEDKQEKKLMAICQTLHDENKLRFIKKRGLDGLIYGVRADKMKQIDTIISPHPPYHQGSVTLEKVRDITGLAQNEAVELLLAFAKIKQANICNIEVHLIPDHEGEEEPE